MIDRVCEQCGGAFAVPASYLKKSPRYGRFCGHTCRGLWWKGKNLGGRTTLERVWDRIDKNGPVPSERPDLGPCWLWTGSTNDKGYGHTSDAGRQVYVHRVTYEAEHGTIPTGKVLDHLCRVHHCARPSHLEAVPQRTNVLRGESHVVEQTRRTTCPKGHPLEGENLLSRKGKRECRTCHYERMREVRRAWRAKQRERRAGN